MFTLLIYNETWVSVYSYHDDDQSSQEIMMLIIMLMNLLCYKQNYGDNGDCIRYRSSTLYAELEIYMLLDMYSWK